MIRNVATVLLIAISAAAGYWVGFFGGFWGALAGSAL